MPRALLRRTPLTWIAHDRWRRSSRIACTCVTPCRSRRGDAVLDVGSGNGEEVCEIAAIVGVLGRVVGVDLSNALVEEARRRAPSTLANIEFVVGDGHALPFEDGEFDSVRAERTLQHVDDPARVATEMVRVVRSGGRVAVWEPDWGLLFIGSTDQETSTIVAGRVAAAVRNPRIGRNLASVFRRAGLRDLSVVARIGLWETLAAAEERARLTPTVHEAVAGGQFALDRAERWLAELGDDDAAGSLVAGVCGVVVSGRKQ